MKLHVIALACLLGCPKPKQEDTGPTIARVAELGALMKTSINPAFSKLTFLVFHADELENDPASIKLELRSSAAALRDGTAKLHAWRNPPTSTQEGQAVFFTYADSVERMAGSLAGAIERQDERAMATTLERIATTCNNCHHFFRLRIEDSVVPNRAR